MPLILIEPSPNTKQPCSQTKTFQLRLTKNAPVTKNRSHTREQIMFYRDPGMTENLCGKKHSGDEKQQKEKTLEDAINSVSSQ